MMALAHKCLLRHEKNLFDGVCFYITIEGQFCTVRPEAKNTLN